uniref:Uncharacterized protein n=1 Tax=Arundo donax TaxID=35708 RepID=A0A0A9BZE5_ARUDO
MPSHMSPASTGRRQESLHNFAVRWDSQPLPKNHPAQYGCRLVVVPPPTGLRPSFHRITSLHTALPSVSPQG